MILTFISQYVYVLIYNKSTFAQKIKAMKLRIKEAIKSQGYTVQGVAEKIGKSKQSLHGIIEKGNPTINTLSDIAGAIGVSISELYEEPEPNSKLACPHCGKPITIKLEKPEI